MTGLVGWWPLHRTVGDAVDLSGEGNDGTITNSPTRGVAGRGGLRSYSFNGSDTRVESPDLGLSSGDDFTIAAWVNPSNTSDYGSIVGRFDGSDDILNLHKRGDNQEWRVQLGHDGGDRHYSASGGTVEANVWKHVACVFDASGPSTEVYQNGSSVGSDSGTIDDFATGDGPWIGARSDSSEFFSGAICDVRIYNRALSSSELTRLYEWGNGDYAQPPSDLDDTNAVSYWTLDEDPSNTSTATDSFGSNDGTINSATQQDPAIRGTGINFDGNDDYINCGSVSLNSTETHTFALWLKTTQSPGSTNDGDVGRILEHHELTSSGDRPMTVGLTQNGEVTHGFFTSSHTPDRDQTVSSRAINIGDWVHVAGVRDSGTWTLYLNGERDATMSNNPTTVDSAEFQMGATLNDDGTVGSAYYSGDMDDVRIYDRALSKAEIHDVYRYGTFGRDLRDKTVRAV